MRSSVLALALILCACGSDSKIVHCTATDPNEPSPECMNQGQEGFCQAGLCTFTDDCASGRRYGPNSGSLSGSCVVGSVPDASSMDLAETDLQMPDLQMPDLQMPDLQMPDLQTPDLQMPDLQTPDFQMPDLSPVNTLSVNMTSDDFGPLDIGSTATTQTFTISNEGTPTTGALIVGRSGDTGDFHFSYTCATPLTANANCFVEVQFKPLTAGMKSMTVTVHDSGVNTVSFTVTGLGIATLNYAFITSGLYNGNLGGLSGADATCQSVATSANLPGHYVAFLTTAATTAYNRLSGISGWKGTDGLPFADTVSSLQSGQVYYPIAHDELGNPLSFPDYWWTGGVGNSGCSDMGSSSGSQTSSVAAIGGAGRFSGFGTQACNTTNHLLCLQTDHVSHPTLPSPTGRLMFVTKSVWISGTSGGPDLKCANDAAAAGLNGSFLAFIDFSNMSASSRFTAHGVPIERVDGVTVAASDTTFLAIDSSRLLSAVEVSADGLYLGGQSNKTVWTGGAGTTDLANYSCTNWTSGAGTNPGVLRGGDFCDIFGSTGVAAGYFFDPSTAPSCSGSSRLYCLQE